MRSYAFLLFPIEWPQIVSLDYISAGPVAEWLRRQSIEEGGRRQKKAEEGRRRQRNRFLCGSYAVLIVFHRTGSVRMTRYIIAWTCGRVVKALD